MADSAILNEGLKYAINRETPSQGDETGRFWPHGTRTWPDGQSMPSGHSITAWSFAHVIANRYPSWHTKLLVYGMATTVSVSRVLAREHFPSDVLVGSTLGYLIGGYVAHKRGEVSKKFSFSMVDTANGRGMQLSYNFNH
jgi:membrane-associated phospholipid phosphatase